MDVAVPSVVPDPLRFELEGIEMGCKLVMGLSMGTAIASATDISADETDPQICRRVAGSACGESRTGRGRWRGGEGT